MGNLEIVGQMRARLTWTDNTTFIAKFWTHRLKTKLQHDSQVGLLRRWTTLNRSLIQENPLTLFLIDFCGEVIMAQNAAFVAVAEEYSR